MTSRYAKKMKAFSEWLQARGAQVLKPTSEWELVRFKTGDGTSIVYTNTRGTLSFTGESGEAWQAFEQSKPWRGAEATKRQVGRGSVIARTLRQRDGDLCFFCRQEVAIEDESVEHLVPVTAGGPNHITNFFLAHRRCNAEVGHLSAPEKIRRHVTAILSRQVAA